MKKDFDLGLIPIKTTFNPFFKKELFSKKERLREYSKNRLIIGKKANSDIPYFIDTSEAFRMLLIGSTRTGKTFCLRGIGDRMSKAGYSLCYLPDVKNEFYSSRKPLQTKFHSLLLKGEKPKATTIMTFRPTFFKNVREYSELPEYNYWYTPNIKDLSELDFMTLLNADELTEPQRIAVKEIYEQLKDLIGDVSLEDINNIIDGLEDFDDRQKMSLRTKFLPLKYAYFFEHEKQGLDFERLMKARIALSLNMEGFDNITRDGAGLPQVFVSIWLRKLITLRRQRKIAPLIIITDEASRFIPEKGNPSCKLEFMESFDLDARHGINYIVASQQPTKIPEQIITQCKYLLIPYNADIEAFKYLFKLSGVTSWSAVVFAQRCAMIKKKMKKFEWVIINRNTNSYDIIKAVAPLSMHAETTN